MKLIQTYKDIGRPHSTVESCPSHCAQFYVLMSIPCESPQEWPDYHENSRVPAACGLADADLTRTLEMLSLLFSDDHFPFKQKWSDAFKSRESKSCFRKHQKRWIAKDISISKCKLTEFTIPETNSSPLKIDPLKRRILLETTIFRCYVSFPGSGTKLQPQKKRVPSFCLQMGLHGGKHRKQHPQRQGKTW